MRISLDRHPLPRWSAPIDLVRAAVLATVILSVWFPFTERFSPTAIFLLTAPACLALAVRIVSRRGADPAAALDTQAETLFTRQAVLPLPDLAYAVLLIWLSGGIHSPYFPTLFLVVILAGVAHGPESAGWTAAVAGVLVVIRELFDVHKGSPLAWIDDAVATLPYLIMTGLLTGRLSDALHAQQEARLAAQAENLRLQHEGKALQRELELAARVQSALLPPRPPSIPGVEVRFVSRPSREIGGDLYDFLPMPGGAWLFVTADVSGHGVPAALLAAHTQQALRHCAGTDLAAMFRTAGDAVLRQAPEEMFVTAVGVLLDPVQGTARCLTAGHPSPLWWHAATGELTTLPPGGLPLGILEGTGYEVATMQLERGDLLLLFTDGATDAFRPDGTRFGDEGLRPMLAGLADRGGGPEAVVAGLSAALTAAGEPPDDITLLAVQWMGSPCGYSSMTETLASSLLAT